MSGDVLAVWAGCDWESGEALGLLYAMTAHHPWPAPHDPLWFTVSVDFSAEGEELSLDMVTMPRPTTHAPWLMSCGGAVRGRQQT